MNTALALAQVQTGRPEPTSGSWLNLVEILFGILTRQTTQRGTVASFKDIISAIESFIDSWNERCEPFVRSIFLCRQAFRVGCGSA